MSMFRKAERKQAKLRLALFGPSGSGKTFSALQIAMGMGGKIALIDTEQGSGELYAHLCDYDVATIAPPFEPQKYIDLIKMAAQHYDILIIDSLSHAWAGEGGMLDIHDKATQASRSKNSYMAWREVTPLHNKLIDTILQCPRHVIVTARTKVAYEVQEGGQGKKAPVKVGLAPVFREGLDYEMTTCLELSVDGHIATSTKDRTGMFDGRYEVPSPETGKRLLSWLNAGTTAPAMPLPQQLDSQAIRVEIGKIDTVDALMAHYQTHQSKDENILALYSTRKRQILDAEFTSGTEAAPDAEKPKDNPLSDGQRKFLQAHYSTYSREARLEEVGICVGRKITSFNDLTFSEASDLIEAINSHKQEQQEVAA